jgi:CheY-like chemotaxis protein
MENQPQQENGKVTILMIDDEKDVCVFLKSILERTKKFQVVTATNPLDGLALARVIHPDIIFLDIMMPEMSGTEVADNLSLDKATKDIPIVFSSVLVRDEEVKQNNGSICGRYFMSKPVSAEKIIACFDLLLADAQKRNKLQHN